MKKFHSILFASMILVTLSLPAQIPGLDKKMEQMSKTLGNQMQNQIMISMARALFGYTFSVGGYWLWPTEIKNGDWWKYQLTDDEGNKLLVEIAKLRTDAKGNQWWRMGYYPLDEEDNKPFIYEILVDPSMENLLRMRAKMGDEKPTEIPVTENTKSFFMKPSKPTDESIKAATKGIETVKVPAGTFRAKHIVYGFQTGSKIEWWTSKKVPSGVIKYRITGDDGKVVYFSELHSFGGKAKTILGSY